MIGFRLAMHIFVCFVAVATGACSGSDFTGGSASSSGSKGKNPSGNTSDSGDDTEDGDAGEAGDDSGNGSGGSGGSDSGADILVDGDTQSGNNSQTVKLDESEIAIRKQRCWFAVSGTWIAHADYTAKYQDKFPGTNSGNPVGHGERFDNVGGIFLAARTEPYVYNAGGREIDGAVDHTFDSILIAPGMKAVIKDASGTTLYSGNGPLIGASSYYENDPKWKGKYFEALKRRPGLPKWMTDYVAAKPGVEVISLHAGRSVQVSAIPGSDCEF